MTSYKRLEDGNISHYPCPPQNSLHFQDTNKGLFGVKALDSKLGPVNITSA